MAKSYHIFLGDKVELSGYAYSTGGRWTGNGTNLNNFAAMLLGAFHLSAPLAGETHTASSVINAAGVEAAAGYGDGSTNETDARVFFNILVYDKNYNLINTKFQQVTDNNSWDLIDLTCTAVEETYIFAYISNESPDWCEVYIDDVAITYTPSNILQSNEYYPFGMQTAASWTRDNSTNNFLYDQATELNQVSGWYDTPFRGYDPTLGRFMGVDPMADKFGSSSPFVYAGNNPVIFNDPTGLEFAMPGHSFQVQWLTDIFNDIGIEDNVGDMGGGQGEGSSGGFWRASQDADAVKNGTMSLEEYASKYRESNTQDNGMAIDAKVFVSNPDGNGTGLLVSYHFDGTGNYSAGISRGDIYGNTNGGTFYYMGPETSVSPGASQGNQWNSSGPDLGPSSAVLQGVLGAFETGSATGTLQSVGKAAFSTVRAGLKFTKALGSAGAAVSVLSVGYNVANTGNLSGSDITSLVTTGALITAGVVLGTAAAPALAVAGLVVGIASYIGQDYLNETIGTYKLF